MSAVQAIKGYFGLFGVRGVVLATKARLLQKWIETEVNVHGIKYPVHLRLRTTDGSVFRQIFVNREYNCDFCKSPSVIVDAGANIGLTSVFFANKYPEAMIVAIEPEYSNFQMLKKNVAPYVNITAIHAALWKDDCEIDLVDPGVGHDGFQTLEISDHGIGYANSNHVCGVTIAKLMHDFCINHIDILKIDIEGSEKEVFDYSMPWINRVGVIVIELHDELRVGCARSLYLASRDFDVEWRKGETVFLARREYVMGTALPGTDE